ncbi:MAG TPA: hypothetical protein V6D14_11735 [Coleofasciculaceae cyanobacterium]|jgi:hypothetical protein
MIALQNAPITSQNRLKDQPQSGILSEKSAIVICSLAVATFAIPVLVVIQVLSGLYWGGVTLYQLLNGGFSETDEI